MEKGGCQKFEKLPTSVMDGPMTLLVFHVPFNQFRITTGKCHLLKIKEERKELH